MYSNSDKIVLNLRVALLLTLMSSSAVTTSAAEPDDSSRLKRAIAYLDARQDAWAKFTSSHRGKEANQTSCVSCHTGIGHGLARPGLRKYEGKSGPTPTEERMIAAVSLRVEHWDELDDPRFRLWYDHDDRKKVESRGTEPVLNALILARQDEEAGRTEPSAVSKSAFKHLWATQMTTGDNAGSWEWLNFGLEPWEGKNSRAFGASLAAIAVGSAPGYLRSGLDEKAMRGVGLLRDYLRGRFSHESLYNRLWILEASERLDGVLSNEQKREVVDQLLRLQEDDGGWASRRSAGLSVLTVRLRSRVPTVTPQAS